MTKIILFLTFVIFALPAYPQANDAEALLYNISINGVFATISAVINKNPEEKLNKVILKGFAQGTLGGAVTFGSKCLLRETQRENNSNYYWSAKLTNAIGTSIVENASMNRDFWEKWHINFGFNRIEFDSKNKFKIRYKIMPIALVYTVGAALQTRFELEKSLVTGELIFSSSNKRFDDTSTLAITIPGCIVVKNGYLNDLSLVSHEIIHIYQSNTFSVLNTNFQKYFDRLAAKNQSVNFINNHLYFDLHRVVQGYAYNFNRTKAGLNYYDNFFEHEAGYWSNTLNN